MVRLIFLGFLLSIFVSCGGDAPKTILPNTPETVVLTWQAYVDKNMLDSARLLSADQALSYIAFLDGLSDTEPLEVEHNTMINLSCKTAADTTSVCDYYFEDEAGFQMPGRLFLKKTEGQWKVCLVEDVDVPDMEPADSLDIDDLVFPEEEQLEE